MYYIYFKDKNDNYSGKIIAKNKKQAKEKLKQYVKQKYDIDLNRTIYVDLSIMLGIEIFASGQI